MKFLYVFRKKVLINFNVVRKKYFFLKETHFSSFSPFFVFVLHLVVPVLPALDSLGTCGNFQQQHQQTCLTQRSQQEVRKR